MEIRRQANAAPPPVPANLQRPRAPRNAATENGDPKAAVSECPAAAGAYFTPCISRWISGATRNSSTPAPTSAQKPKL
ncbi:hypothetical protein MASR1M8_07880 [Thermomonas brevis]